MNDQTTKIRNLTKRNLQIGRVRLVPGENIVSPKQLERIGAHPAFATWRDQRWIVVGPTPAEQRALDRFEHIANLGDDVARDLLRAETRPEVVLQLIDRIDVLQPGARRELAGFARDAAIKLREQRAAAA